MNTDPLREANLEELRRRSRGATLCPSEAACAVYPEGWRDHMEAPRREARALADEGMITICKGGKWIDLRRGFNGRVRLRPETQMLK